MGTPVLTTTVVSESIITSGTGILVNYESVEDLEKGMLKALKTVNEFNPDVLISHVKKMFAKDIVYEKLKNVYNEILR